MFQTPRSLTHSANQQQLELASPLSTQMLALRSTSNQEVDSILVVIHLMELSAYKVENVEAVFAITSNASHHQLLDQAEKTLSVVRTLIVSQTNSVTQDSALTLEWDFSFQEKMEMLAKMILSACLVFAMQVSASNQILLEPYLLSLDQVEKILSAVVTLTASQTNFVMPDSALTLVWDLSFQE